MSILDKILQALENDRKNALLLADQQVKQMKRDIYKEQYWQIALTLFEAMKEKKTLLRVEIPSAPKLLMPEDYVVRDYSEYGYFMERDKTNPKGGDNAVLPHEVVKILTGYFKLCGYKNIRIYCTEDSGTYRVTLKRLGKFCIGGVLLPKVGKIRSFQVQDNSFNVGGMYDRSGTFYRYFVPYFQGGCGVILPTTKLYVYRYGLWYQSAIAFDKNLCPYLTCFNEYLENFHGCIVHIK
jgi:hypothetical protein